MAHRVLVVDDDLNILQLFARILSKAGHEVHTEQSGGSVLETIRMAGPFDLLILDLCMPGVDGFDVLRLVSSQHLGMKVLVISGFVNGKLLPAAECLGATETLPKSDAPRLLLSRVNRLLEV